jgi:uncharacterized membrane protein (DUF106 family)
MISAFNSVLGRFSDAVLSPFQALNPWIAMSVLSLATAAFMLFVYRLVSDQEGIRTVKNRIAAHLLELRLYKESLPTTFSAQGNILWCSLKYILHSTRPMLVMSLPLVLALVQLDLRFGYRPLRTGETTILRVMLGDGHRPSLVRASIEPSPGFVIETPSLSIDRDRELDWRLRAMEAGDYEISVHLGDEVVTKRLVVGRAGLGCVSPVRASSHWLDQLLHPGERPIAQSSMVESIEIGYPSCPMSLFGWQLHWLIVYLAFSLLLGIALKGILKVEV